MDFEADRGYAGFRTCRDFARKTGTDVERLIYMLVGREGPSVDIIALASCKSNPVEQRGK